MFLLCKYLETRIYFLEKEADEILLAGKTSETEPTVTLDSFSLLFSVFIFWLFKNYMTDKLTTCHVFVK